MNQLLPILLISPLLALVTGFTFSNKQEGQIFWSAALGVFINFLTLLAIAALFMVADFQSVFVKGPVLYRSHESEFALNLFMDCYSLCYMVVATFLTGIILIFSKSYIHREKGYKRFFNNLNFFYFGLMMVLLAGNLETLFIGWEVLGVTSFFLIGFYRERYLPVKNALKVISLYRIADMALLLGIWVSHHYFSRSINFNETIGFDQIMPNILSPAFYQFFIPATFLLAAMVKSAQVPFSSWLPRAMEGPTTSSAIFYGSLSVHMGVFLLIRTAPFWESNVVFKMVIATVGIVTCIMATLTAGVQSTIKTQIAYSSIAQIGLMFIEVALGLYWLAIIHFACNALLRSHQLLVSPSVLSYRIHDQYFHFTPPRQTSAVGIWNRIKLSLYVISIKEFNLDEYMYRLLWNPLKRLGNLVNIFSNRMILIVALPGFFMGLYAVYHQALIPRFLLRFLPELFAIFSLLLILLAFVERKSARSAWVLIVINQLYQSLAFGFNESFDFTQVHIYLSGIFVSAFIGLWAINKLRSGQEDVTLDRFHGHSYEHPRLAFIFVLACLGLAGFPITPTFIGEDLLLSHIRENQFPLLILIVLNLILDGLVVFRIYSRLFLGPHKKGYHEIAYRSS
jgi:NADH:ubiquinone oxidoreductase subunit 5 (subunit L)/multisubunit Na+/H+ antiporter MnhA subunit